MRDLDETDLEILRLLAADGRRPYSDIAEHVGLTPPAVSDRVGRLEDQGIIRRFTVDVDRTKLRHAVTVLVELQPEPGAVDDVYAASSSLDGVEHVFEGADGRLFVHATLSDTDVRSWLETGLDVDCLAGYDVTLITRFDRSLDVSAGGFELDCVVCGKTVTDDGVTSTFDGELKTFCCPSCLAMYESRYETHRDALE